MCNKELVPSVKMINVDVDSFAILEIDSNENLDINLNVVITSLIRSEQLYFLKWFIQIDNQMEYQLMQSHRSTVVW